MIVLTVFIVTSNLTAFVVLLLFTWLLWRNIYFLQWVRQQKSQSDSAPLVSILVPARDESANITACVESLCLQTYPNLEIIVLNDQSTDDTGNQLDQLAVRYPTLHVIHSDVIPPTGWNGKSFACHRLSQKATGEWLLFTDADTIHTPDSIALGLVQAQSLKVDLLSFLPYQQTKTWSERLMVPFIVGFLPLVGWDFKGMWQGRAKRVAANGQFLLIRAEAYRTLNGHEAIHSALVDDFALASHFYHSAHRIAFVDGADMLTCRMYHTTREVWDGFSKNILLALTETGTTKSPPWQSLVFGWAYASVFVTPYILLFLPGAPVALLSIVWLWMLHAIVAKMLRQSILLTPFVSLSAIGVMALSLNALYRRWRSKTIRWKGRVYN